MDVPKNMRFELLKLIYSIKEVVTPYLLFFQGSNDGIAHTCGWTMRH
jgi:hypothetical protein